MVIKTAEFIASNTNMAKCPPADKPEYAFIGRSNVGKSSLINRLLGRSNLARTSSTPGKTRLINHFLINSNWYLVDLPGYGYARISKKEREKWETMIRQYLTRRVSLMSTFVLIDARIEPKASDIDFINWCGSEQLPVTIVFTKADKISAAQLDENTGVFKKRLLEFWDELPDVFITSAETGSGRDSLLAYIERLNSEYIEIIS